MQRQIPKTKLTTKERLNLQSNFHKLWTFGVERDELIETGTEKVINWHPELSSAEARAIATKIADFMGMPHKQ